MSSTKTYIRDLTEYRAVCFANGTDNSPRLRRVNLYMKHPRWCINHKYILVFTNIHNVLLYNHQLHAG
jgi:hypothetical protein